MRQLLFFAILLFSSITTLAEELSEAEAQSVLQQFLDMDDLQIFYHPSANGRIPVKLHISNFTLKPNLTKFEHHVLLLNEDNGSAEIIRIDALRPNMGFLYFEFSYQVEGVVGSAYFVKREGIWVLERSEVYES
jgi:hypothetical protein